MLHVAIVDDEEQVRQDLADMVGRYASDRKVDLCVSTYENAEDFLDSGAVEEIVLMDIELPGIDGMAAARRMRAAGITAELMFVTNMAQLAIEGYEVNALDFVVKPVSYESFSFKFRRAVANATRRRSAFVRVPTREGIMTIRASKISYVEVRGHRLLYHVAGETIEATGTMRETAGELEPFGFAQCHASYLVNLELVTRVLGDHVMVANTSLPISRNRKRPFLDALTRGAGA